MLNCLSFYSSKSLLLIVNYSGRFTRSLSAIKKIPNDDFSLKSVISQWTKKFKLNNVLEPDSSAEYIVAHVLGEKTISCANMKQILKPVELHEIGLLCQKRLTSLPIQYVIEEWDFAGLNLRMNPPVFIPRPETHGLVDAVIQEINSSFNSLSVLEVGCGSGAISLALLDALKQKSITKAMNLTAIDKDENAVALTKHNAVKTGLLDLKVLHCDINTFPSNQQFNGIVSNPPYIPTNDMKSLQIEILNFESKLALDGGIDGLDVVKQIIDKAALLLPKNGWIWLEVDSSHPEVLKKLPQDFVLTEIKKDLFNRNRFVKLIKIS